MRSVTVLPLGLVLELGPDETVMAAARAAGYGWPTVCDASASCGTCVSIIREGEANCGPMPDDERETLDRTLGSVDGDRRLACRLTVTGPVTLTKRGVHPIEES
ncbi:MAG: 2Fe-2S iron-sulfur cluster-binding protein [Actinobacteria bacterium]|nr:2Fe-2S iron-sulfur cluster-binding protein [Actinomycetota bacterium]